VTNFYIARDSDGDPRWVAAHDVDGEDRLFVWLTNDRAWHHNAALENEFYSLTPAMTFMPITADEAARRILAWPALDPLQAGWIVDELAAAPTLTVVWPSTALPD
jgi:hypothetical protein